MPNRRLDVMAQININLDKIASKNTQKLSVPIFDQKTETLDKDNQDRIDKAAGVNSSVQQLKEELKRQKEEAAQKEKEEKLRAKQQKAGIVQTGNVIDTVTDAYSGAHNTVMETTDKVKDTASNLWDSIGRITTPGSIFLPITVLLLFFFLLLPVNGHTRIEWLFFALTGNAKISGSQEPRHQSVETDVLEAVQSVYQGNVA